MSNQKKDVSLETNYQVPFIPKDQPFNQEQRQWLSGFLAGLHNRLLVLEGDTSQTQETAISIEITIIYGSQTGNAESVAELAAEQAKAKGLKPNVLDMDDLEIAQLSNIQHLLVVTSTYGEGEMPDNAQALWDTINEDDAPSLNHLEYSVLALGDTSYDEYCLAGKLWDKRLSELGAKSISQRVDCDVAFEEPSEAWLEEVLSKIAVKGADSSLSHSTAEQTDNTKTQKSVKSKHNRNHPFYATLTRKQILTSEKSSKEVVHFEFSLAGSDEYYDAGDALNIIPTNRPETVQLILDYFNTDGTQTLDEYDHNIQETLTNQLEIRIPSKELIARLADLAAADNELVSIVNDGDKTKLSDFLWAKDSLDLLKMTANETGPLINIAEFISLCKPLAARAYSISSSIKKHPEEVHLTIGSVRYQSEDRQHHGVCSTYLADLVEEGEKVPCYFSANKNFSVPKDTTKPIIMVGPGTGIAPFIAFLEEREKTSATGENWLFFGDRNSDTDFLYQDELDAMKQTGLLTYLDLAFSRDQAEKVYVQDRMRQQGQKLFNFLEGGAYFYICGDALRMAKDVDLALHDIIAEHGEMSEDEAISYINALKKNKRYVRDVY